MKFPIPYQWRGKMWLCASNQNSILLLEYRYDIVVHDYTPDFTKFFMSKYEHTEILLSVSDLQAAYDLIPLITKRVYADCYSCDGRGRFDHRGHEYGCQSCKGSGKSDHDYTISTVKDEDYLIRLDGKYFTATRWNDLIKVLQIVKPDRVRLHQFQEEREARIFLLDDDAVLVLMPYHVNESLKSKFQIIDIPMGVQS